MKKTVVIVEKKTNKPVARYDVVMAGQNYVPSDAEYFKEAWRNATDDKVVDPNRKDDYSLAFAK